MNLHFLSPPAEVFDARDALNDIHTATGTLATVLDHVNGLALNLRYNEVPETGELNIIQALLAMTCSWAKELDHDVGDASGRHSMALRSSPSPAV